MAGITNYNTTQLRDGVSFVPLLKNTTGATNKNKDFYWHFPNKWGETADGSDTYSAIRSGDFKFVYRWTSQVLELYNIKDDIGEKNNLLINPTDEAKAKMTELSRKLADYLRNVNAQRPTYTSIAKLCPWPDEVKLPTSPVQPKISDVNNEYWYKIHDNRSPNYFWQIDGTGKLIVSTEIVANDTTTADKLYKIQLAPDGTGYRFFSMTNKTVPISAANTSNNTNLFVSSTNPINSWTYSPSSAVPGYYLIAAKSDNRQLKAIIQVVLFLFGCLTATQTRETAGHLFRDF